MKKLLTIILALVFITGMAVAVVSESTAFGIIGTLMVLISAPLMLHLNTNYFTEI